LDKIQEEDIQKLIPNFSELLDMDVEFTTDLGQTETTLRDILKLEKDRNYAEVILHVPKNDFKTEAVDDNMYLAIDEAIEKAEKQIKKLKGKWDDHKKKSLKENSNYVYANLYKEGEKSERISTKRIIAEALTVDEALSRFKLTNDPYLIFKNLETDRINVLVKKDEQHFKLLEP